MVGHKSQTATLLLHLRSCKTTLARYRLTSTSPIARRRETPRRHSSTFPNADGTRGRHVLAPAPLRENASAMPDLPTPKVVVMLAEAWRFSAFSARVDLGTREWKANASPTVRQVATEATKINARAINLLPLLLPRVLVAAEGCKGKLLDCRTVRT